MFYTNIIIMEQKEFELAGIAPSGGKAHYQRPKVRVYEMGTGACILAGSEQAKSPKSSFDGINEDSGEGSFDE